MANTKSKSTKSTRAKAVEPTPAPAADTPELVTPEEHAEVTENVEPGVDVAAPEVPADVEVGARSADMDDPSTTHEKVFVLGPNPADNSANPYTEAKGYDHEPNKLATRQYAIDQGVWPTGDVSHKSTKRHPDGVSWILTYTVPVIPAHDAKDGGQTPSVSAVALPETDDDGNPTGGTTVVAPLNYSPPEDVAEHGTNADGDQTA